MDVRLRRARPHESEALAGISRRSFDSDEHIGAPGPGGPPGYADPGWQQRMMARVDYLSILLDGAIVGGAIVTRLREGLELTRLFVDPDHFRQGIGTRAMELLDEAYPKTQRWILDTPAWNPRTRAFYESIGFTEYGRKLVAGDFELALYERVREA